MFSCLMAYMHTFPYPWHTFETDNHNNIKNLRIHFVVILPTRTKLNIGNELNDLATHLGHKRRIEYRETKDG